MKFDELAKKIYKQNKKVGWWDDPDRCIYQTLQLVSSEISEATEGERKNLMDNHLPHRKAGEVELADALIRVLDLGGRYGWEYKLNSGYSLEIIHVKSIGGKHFVCNITLVKLAKAIINKRKTINRDYSQLINCICKVAELQLYDIEGALHEKLEYNKNRLDHKRENRDGEHGKKF